MPKPSVTVALGLALLALGSCGRPDLEDRALHIAIDEGIDYLGRAQREDGSFVYSVSLTPGFELPPDYNMLRHAGTLYAMGQYSAWGGSRDVAGPMQSAARYMIACCVAEVAGSDSVLTLWSPPEITLDDGPLEAKLGGAGLALIGLTRLAKVAPESTEKSLLRGIGRFILLMQREDGSFFSKYIPAEGGPNDEWTSLYYPGEAALGLVHLYEVDPDPIWLDAAVKAMAYLAQSRRDSRSVPPDHWALIATAALFDDPGDRLSDEKSELLYSHALQVVRSMLGSDSGTDEANPLTVRGQPTSTATRLEGLLAIGPHLRAGDREVRERLCALSQDAMRYLLESRFSEGPFVGGIPQRAYWRSGEFRRRGDIRIDYVQHAVSAFIAYDGLHHEAVCG